MNFHDFFQPTDESDESMMDIVDPMQPNSQQDQSGEELFVLIGATEFKQVDDSTYHGSREVSIFTIYVRSLDHSYNIFKFEAINRYDSCYSGYTFATWGRFGPLVRVDRHNNNNVGSIHFVPRRNPTHVQIIKQFKQDRQSSLVLSILDTMDGQEVVHNTGDGGDNYYPSGKSWLNMTKFKLTNRVPSKRPLYILTGDSGLGKSFLAQRMINSNGEKNDSAVRFIVYETDSNADLPIASDLWKYHAIVVGNKYRHHSKTIFNNLQAIEDMVNLIHIPFQRVPKLINRIYDQIIASDAQQLPDCVVEIIAAFAI